MTTSGDWETCKVSILAEKKNKKQFLHQHDTEGFLKINTMCECGRLMIAGKFFKFLYFYKTLYYPHKTMNVKNQQHHIVLDI